MEFLDIQAIIECGFTPKLFRDMTKRPVWSNGWVFVYELSGSGFESSCNHLNFKFHACFEQVVPWHSGNCRVWIHSETRTWHDKSIQSIWDSNMRISFWKKSIFYYFISSQYEIQRSPCSSLVSQVESLTNCPMACLESMMKISIIKLLWHWSQHGKY